MVTWFNSKYFALLYVAQFEIQLSHLLSQPSLKLAGERATRGYGVLRYKPAPTNQQSRECSEILTARSLVPASGISQVRTPHNHYILS